jgi:hypothetical protein
MGIQFIKKRFPKRPNVTNKIKKEEEVKPKVIESKQVEIIEEPQMPVETELEVTQTVKNKKNKKDKKDMLTKEQLSAIENAVDGMNPTVKVVKTDRGLIERTESSKIIITEDNRQVLND